MKYNIVIDNNTCENIFSAIEKYLYQYGNTKIQYHFDISQAQFINIYQQFDVENYETFDEMFDNFNRAPGTRSDVVIDKAKYKKIITLLLAYDKEVIEF